MMPGGSSRTPWICSRRAARPSSWRAHGLRLARALAARGRPEAAADEARRALDLLGELKAELEMSRARALLDSLQPLRRAEGKDEASAQRGGLTKREIEVLRLVATGLNNQLIANQLFVSEHTIHRHIANIFTKLSVSSRAAAVAQAARKGLLT